MVHDSIIHADILDGFVAIYCNKIVGLITYMIKDDECEIITLDSLVRNQGIGRKLIQTVGRAAVASKCRRLWLVTTNDNLNALRFYQRLGFQLCGLRTGAVDKSRKIKPEIPYYGENGIPILDEIDLEIDPNRLVELVD